jgi:probable rRNA maturation factor
MNRVEISAEEAPVPLWCDSLKHYALKVLDRLGRDKWDLSILLCGDRTISDLNSRYRGKAEATDVLSFTMNEGGGEGGGLRLSHGRIVPGDIVISLDTLRENAGRFKTSEDEELRRLLIHGILHLDGMDHSTNKETEPMLRFQEQILTELAQERIMEKGGDV